MALTVTIIQPPSGTLQVADRLVSEILPTYWGPMPLTGEYPDVRGPHMLNAGDLTAPVMCTFSREFNVKQNRSYLKVKVTATERHASEDKVENLQAGVTITVDYPGVLPGDVAGLIKLVDYAYSAISAPAPSGQSSTMALEALARGFVSASQVDSE